MCRSLPQMLAVVTRTMASSGVLEDRLRHLLQPDVAGTVVDDSPHPRPSGRRRLLRPADLQTVPADVLVVEGDAAA